MVIATSLFIALLSSVPQEASWRKIDFSDDMKTGALGVHSPASSYAPSHAIRALRKQTALLTDYRIKLAILKEDKHGAILAREQGIKNLTSLMTQEERNWFSSEIWKIKKVGPDSEFAKLLNTKELVSELKGIGDPRDREIYELTKQGLDRIQRPYETYRKRSREEARSLGIDPDEHYRNGYAKYKLELYDAYAAFSSTPVSEPRTPAGADVLLARVALNEFAGTLRKIAERLSPTERDEWDRFLTTLKL